MEQAGDLLLRGLELLKFLHLDVHVRIFFHPRCQAHLPVHTTP